MAEDTPLERLNEEAKLRAAMARNPQRTPVQNGRPTLEEEYAAQRAAGLHKDDDVLPAKPAGLPTTAMDRDIAANVAEAAFRILSAP